MDPLVSIVIPCFKQAQYLSDAIRSVLQQTYSNWECIVVDDGSPDDTSDVAAEFTKADHRIVYVRKNNGGLSDARNFGIASSKGAFILPLDADDKIGPRYLSDAVNVFKMNPSISVVYPRAAYFGERDGIWEVHYKGYRELLLTNSIFCSAIFRRSDFDRVGGYDTSMRNGFEDWEFWIRLLENDDPSHSQVYEIPDIQFYYRIKKNSMVLDLVKSKEVESKTINYVVTKHIDKYTRYFGGITHYIREHQRYKSSEAKVRSRFVSKLLWWLSKKSVGLE